MPGKDFDPSTVTPDGRAAAIARLFTPGEGPARGALNGTDLGAGITVLAYGNDVVGTGPKLHLHPYDEVFVVQQGRALFTVGEQQVEASAGEVVLGPAGVPHLFVNLGPGRLQTTDIHLSPEWIQHDLE